MTAGWQNWARTEHARPVLRVAPRSIDQVVLAVQRAAETGHTVKPIGASHSFSGIAATDGVLLDMSRLRGLVDADLESGRVTLWAGTHLWELPGLLNPLGLALENMGDVDRQTISGATSTGTHGTGLGFGGLSTRVVGATLVTGTGEVRVVSETENPELLPAVALGLGALGVLVTVTLQCVPRYLLRAVEAPAPLDDVLDSFEERCREADHFEFFWFPGTRGTRTKTNTRQPMDAAARPLSAAARFIDAEVMNNLVFGSLAATERWLPASTPGVNRMIQSLSSRREYCDESHRVYVTQRRVKFREMEYSVPLAAAPTVVREIRGLIARRGYRVSFPLEVRAAAADELWLSTAHARESAYIALHRYWRDPDTAYFREAEEILVAHGGRPHWGKMHSRTSAQLREVYPHFDEFVGVRDALDPQRVFTNPYLQRVLGE